MVNDEAKINAFKEEYESFLEKLDGLERSDHWDKTEIGELDALLGSDIINVAIRLMAADGEYTGKEMLRVNELFGFDYKAPEIDTIYEDYKEGINHVIDVEIEENYKMLQSAHADVAAKYLSLINMVADIIGDSDEELAESEQAVIAKLKSIGTV